MPISSPNTRLTLYRRLRHCFALVLLATCLPNQAAELLYFYDPDCGACQDFGRKVGTIYPKTEEAELAPMRKINIAALDQATIRQRAQAQLQGDIPGTPVFVLVDKGREIDRFSGFSSDELFWMSLQRLLNQLSP